MKYNRTAMRTIEMLELISDHPNGLSLAEITGIMDIPKTSAYDILVTLEHMQMVEMIDERSKVYGLGVKSFVVGSKYIDEIELVKVAKPFIEALGNQLSKTVFVGINNGDKIVYLDKYRPKSEILTTCKIGAENPVHCTSLGKALLAFSDDYKERVEGLDLYPKTDYTITDKDEFCEELRLTRERGYSVDDREHQDHMLCTGAPIFNHNGKVVAAISVTGLYIEDKDYHSEHILVKETAHSISSKLGYRGDMIRDKAVF